MPTETKMMSSNSNTILEGCFIALAVLSTGCLETLGPIRYSEADSGPASESPLGGISTGGVSTPSGDSESEQASDDNTQSDGAAGENSTPGGAEDDSTQIGGQVSIGGLPMPVGGRPVAQGGAVQMGGSPLDGHSMPPSPPRCDDDRQNGTESDVDCGGDSCQACEADRLCALGSDCISGVCMVGICQRPSCADDVRNGSERDVDCGGVVCPSCPVGSQCRTGADCDSGVCINEMCAEPRCGDGLVNGREQCDDGNQVDDDGCRADCTLPSCGNGAVDPNEGSCDCAPGSINLDGNPANGCECQVSSERDDMCDGVDVDCDGIQDEDYTPPADLTGDCEQFDGPCDRTGVVVVTRRVCQNGRVNNERVRQVCARQTDGTEVRVDEWSECGRFNGPCDQDGQRSRDVSICRNGLETNQTEFEECNRNTEGVIVGSTVWGDCQGFADQCDEAGVQNATNTVCRNGVGLEEAISRECNRDTDGTVLNEEPFGLCIRNDANDVCSYSGLESKNRVVCRDGQSTEEVASRDCPLDTDGTVVSQGPWGMCGGFEGVCGEAGQQYRNHFVCRQEMSVNEPKIRACSRDTDGIEVNVGPWGACAGFESACDESGTQSREKTTCENGRANVVIEFRPCFRDTDDQEVSVGDWGACGDFDSDCSEIGVQSRTRVVCSDGEKVSLEDRRVCERDTDGNVLFIGSWGDCSYPSECADTGARFRGQIACRMGQAVQESVSEVCIRDRNGGPCLTVDMSVLGICVNGECRRLPDNPNNPR